MYGALTGFTFSVCRHRVAAVYAVISLQISLSNSGLLFMLAVVKDHDDPEMRSAGKREGQGDGCHGVGMMLRRLNRLKTDP